jgi:hypothetical protein
MEQLAIGSCGCAVCCFEGLLYEIGLEELPPKEVLAVKESSGKAYPNKTPCSRAVQAMSWSL